MCRTVHLAARLGAREPLPERHRARLGPHGTGNAIPQVWNTVTSAFVATPADLERPEHLLLGAPTTLRDGRVLVAGGHVTSHVGFPAGNVFDPLTKQWSTTPDMTYARWYPTLTALPMVGSSRSRAGGRLRGLQRAVPEIYDRRPTRWTTHPAATFDLPFYPNTYVLPNGKVLVAASAEDPVRAVRARPRRADLVDRRFALARRVQLRDVPAGQDREVGNVVGHDPARRQLVAEHLRDRHDGRDAGLAPRQLDGVRARPITP
jgi:hypothetical protein